MVPFFFFFFFLVFEKLRLPSTPGSRNKIYMIMMKIMIKMMIILYTTLSARLSIGASTSLFHHGLHKVKLPLKNRSLNFQTF